MRFILLLVAAVIAVGAGVFALQWSNKNTPAQAPVAAGGTPMKSVESSNVATVDILVAKQPISVGTVITEAMIDKQPWPQNLVLDGFIVDGSKDSNLVGKVARTDYQAREPFMANKIANPNDPSFLASNLPEGMRALTLSTDAVSGVAGYVFPGDKIDVLLTHNIPENLATRAAKPGMPAPPHIDKPAFTEVLVPNAKVLAVNVREPAGKEVNTIPTSVTIEVDAVHAQKIRLGEKLGTLSLALRSLKDRDSDQVPAPTAMEYLTQVKLAPQGSDGIKIVRGVSHDNDDMAAKNADMAGGMMAVNPMAAASESALRNR